MSNVDECVDGNVPGKGKGRPGRSRQQLEGKESRHKRRHDNINTWYTL